MHVEICARCGTDRHNTTQHPYSEDQEIKRLAAIIEDNNDQLAHLDGVVSDQGAWIDEQSLLIEQLRKLAENLLAVVDAHVKNKLVAVEVDGEKVMMDDFRVQPFEFDR